VNEIELRMACLKLALEMHKRPGGTSLYETAEAYYQYVKNGKLPETKLRDAA
jgi:hypothetical protein